jgi:GNAT superfamily N-acetyltransferase
MELREMTPRDRRYVVPTWALSSKYDGLNKAKRFRLVDQMLADGARVVVLATNDITVHAWAAATGDVLHYVYVPPALRGHGLARRLITALLGRYADAIQTTHPWPGQRARFLFTPHADRVRDEAA